VLAQDRTVAAMDCPEGVGVIHVNSALRAHGVIPVVQFSDPVLAVPLVDLLVDAGLPCIEITFRAPGAERAIQLVRTQRPEVLVGAGTVLTLAQADAALDAGAQFVVAPGTNPRVVEHVLARGGVMLPGIATPSEIEANLRRGIDVLKFFPAESLGGIGFLRSVHGPFPEVSFVPSGGLSAANLPAYLALANVTAVGGTWIAPRSLLEAGDLESITQAAREAVAIVQHARRAPEVP